MADLTSGRAHPFPQADAMLYRLASGLIAKPTVVDATPIYASLVAKDEPVYLYEDHPCIAPPWDEAAICYVNDHGNVIVMHTTVAPADERWESDANDVDWDRVKWIVMAFVWIGGTTGDGRHFPVTGPVFMWELAVYPDGQPADIHWVHLVPEYPLEHWDMAQLVLLGALNFCNCRNVALVDPVRPRAEARRIARTGITVNTINVFGAGSSTRGPKGDPVGVPLSSVRGHFACYGPEYDRGLLFGKYAGRFWHPQHARGTADLGTAEHDYRLTP